MSKIIEYNGNNTFDGIFNHLSKKCDGNPVDKNIVESFAKGQSSNPKDLLNYSQINDGWYLNEVVDNYFAFDFKEKKVSVNAYSIRSGENSSHWDHPVSFAIEGSNDKTNWKTIDEKTDNTDIGDNLKPYTWKCKQSSFYRYIRFRLIKINQPGVLRTSLFELFGLIKK